MSHTLQVMEKAGPVRGLFSFGAFFLLATLSAREPLARDADRSVALAGALQDLVAAEYALDTAMEDYRQARTEGALGTQEQGDFENFLGSLWQSVHRACERVSSLDGSLAGHQAYCLQVGAGAPVSVPGSARTRTERIAAIDSELEASIAEFDELLLREQGKLEASATSTGARGGGAAGGGREGGQGRQGGEQGQQGQQGLEGMQRGEQGRQGREGQQGRAGDMRTAQGGFPDGAEQEGDGRRGSIGPGGGAGAEIPDDIPEAQDDDIVARQLREAAENEPDPELRKRLWDEYRRYKQSQRGG